MTELQPRDAWHDDLLATIRARAEQNEQRLGPLPGANDPVYNWPEVSSRLSRAEAAAVADAAIPVDRRHRGIRRVLILRVRTLIVSLLRFLTARQSRYNLDVLQALRETGKTVRSLETRLTARDDEVRQLRERLSHLERHLPTEAVRQAS